jgi:hypothetical protein
MSDELDPHSEPVFSSFWPLLILLIGLLIWLGTQDFFMNIQWSGLSTTLKQAAPAVNEAKYWHRRYDALVDDLYKTAQKDDAAKPIATAAVQAGVQSGLIHVQQGAGANAPAPAAPPADSTGAK